MYLHSAYGTMDKRAEIQVVQVLATDTTLEAATSGVSFTRGAVFMLKKTVLSGCAAGIFLAVLAGTVVTGVKSPIESQIAPGLKKEAKEMKSFFRSPESETMIAEIQRNLTTSHTGEGNSVELYEGLAFEPKKAYEVYTLKSEHVIREFDQNGTFKDNISEEYVLQVPLSNSQNELVGLTLFYKEQGGFELFAYGEMEEKQEVLTDMEELNALVNGQEELRGQKEIKDAKTVVLYQYNTYAIYIETADAEYMIPISANNVMTQLEENRIYTAEEFIDVLRLTSSEDINSENPLTLKVGGFRCL